MLAQSRPSGHIAAMTAQLPYATLQKIFQTFQAANAAPEGELHHTNAYTLLVAVALSAQATDVGVNKATKALFAVADTPQKMLALGEAALIDHIKTIGLFRNKAKIVIRLSQMLIEDYAGQVPSSRAALERFYQIPIFVATYQHVKYLRDMYGFDMFDDLVNHSYDDEIDNGKRLFMIADEIRRLNENPQVVRDFYKNNEDRFIKNRNIIYEILNDKRDYNFFQSLI